MRIFKRQNFNDTLALVVVTFTFILWGFCLWFKLEWQVVLAATLPILTLVVQFYFRRAPANGRDEAHSGGTADRPN